MSLFCLKEDNLHWLLPEKRVLDDIADESHMVGHTVTGLPLVYAVFHDYAFSPTAHAVSPSPIQANCIFCKGRER